MLKFVFLFALCLIVLGVIYSYLVTEFSTWLEWLLSATAASSGAAASLFAGRAVWTGTEVVCDGFPIRIIAECTGLLEMVILSSAIIAYPSSIRAKIVGLLGGNFLIYVLNVVRIAVLLVVGSYSQGVFKFMHLYLWQATLIIMISAVWVAWLYLVVYREKKKTVAVFD